MATNSWRDRAAASIAESKKAHSDSARLPFNVATIDVDTGSIIHPDGFCGNRIIIPLALDSDSMYAGFVFMPFDDGMNCDVNKQSLIGLRISNYGADLLKGYMDSCTDKELPIWHAPVELRTTRRTTSKGVYFNPFCVLTPMGSFSDDEDFMRILSTRCSEADELASKICRASPYNKPAPTMGKPARKRSF